MEATPKILTPIVLSAAVSLYFWPWPPACIIIPYECIYYSFHLIQPQLWRTPVLYFNFISSTLTINLFPQLLSNLAALIKKILLRSEHKLFTRCYVNWAHLKLGCNQGTGLLNLLVNTCPAHLHTAPIAPVCMQAALPQDPVELRQSSSIWALNWEHLKYGQWDSTFKQMDMKQFKAKAEAPREA